MHSPDKNISFMVIAAVVTSKNTENSDYSFILQYFKTIKLIRADLCR